MVEGRLAIDGSTRPDVGWQRQQPVLPCRASVIRGALPGMDKVSFHLGAGTSIHAVSLQFRALRTREGGCRRHGTVEDGLNNAIRYVL